MTTSIGYGPPDLCYILVDSVKLFGSNQHKGYYHYVYGADVSSSASVAAYINALQNKAIDNGRSIKRKIIKGIFCIYDSFFKVDVRVEVNLPGMTKSYSIWQSKKREIKEIEWDCAFISSVLRCMHALPCSASHKMKLLSNDKVFIELLNSLLRVYKKRFTLCVPVDIPEQSSQPLFWYLTEFLKEKQRLRESLEFFETLKGDDEEFVIFVAEFLCLIGKHSEALHSIAKSVVHSPFNVSLLYKEASILMQMKRYNEAVTIGEHLVRKAADSFSAWNLLALAHMSNYQLRQVSDLVVPHNPRSLASI